jgi:hypothetical protein
MNHHTIILLLCVLVLILTLLIVLKKNSSSENFVDYSDDKCWFLRNTSEWDKCMYSN